MQNKRKTVIKILLTIFMIIVLSYTTINAAIIKTDWPDEGNSIDKVDNVAQNVWGTVVTIIQMLAFAAIIFAGLRYMLTSSEGRANIKKEMTYLIFGAILVFATTTVIQFVVSVTNEIIHTN